VRVWGAVLDIPPAMNVRRVVLLVEDLPALREELKGHLTAAEFEVVACNDYHGAVRALETCVPHLVCLDLTLPRESGYELCEHIRKKSSLNHVPVLVMSDRASPEDMAHAEHVGANAFLKKPFSRDRLLKYVSVLLDGPHASRPSVRRLRRGEPSEPG
jgi:DNA-binding response OmpR family regulator